MHFLRREYETLEASFPHLRQALGEVSLLEMERPGNPAIALFREHGVPKMLISRKYGGLDASPLQAVRIHRALGSLAPSGSIALTMHNFSVRSLGELSESQTDVGIRWLLEGVAQRNLYVASAFAEGRPGASIMNPTMEAEEMADGDLIIRKGSKKPCSLTHSADLLTASVSVKGFSASDTQIAVVMIPAKTEGIRRKRFWANVVLSGAESDEIILENVHVPRALVSYTGKAGQMDDVQRKAWAWFQMLISASYLGIASALIERVIRAGRGSQEERVDLVKDIEGAMMGLEGVAQSIDNDDVHLDRILAARYATEDAIFRATAQALRLMGGTSFIGSGGGNPDLPLGLPEGPYLFLASHGLALHPPSRQSTAKNLDRYLSGATETVVVE